MLHIKEVLD